jgi:hypothetical protein
MRSSRHLALVALLGSGVLTAGAPLQAAPQSFELDCPDVSSEERAEIEARFRSGCLVRGITMPGFRLHCGAGELELQELPPGSGRVLHAVRASAPLVEQFVGLFVLWLEQVPPASPIAAPAGPKQPEERPIQAVESVPAGSGGSVVAAVDSSTPADAPAPDTPAAAEGPVVEAAPQEAAPTDELAKRPKVTPAARPVESSRAGASSTVAFVGPLFSLWATSFPGVLGAQAGVRHVRGSVGGSVELAALVSPSDPLQLRPFEADFGAGFFWLPWDWLALEIGGLASLLAVFGGGVDAPVDVEPNAYAKARFAQKLTFGALYGELGLRVGPERVGVTETFSGAADTVPDVSEYMVVPAAAPTIAVGASFNL